MCPCEPGQGSYTTKELEKQTGVDTRRIKRYTAVGLIPAPYRKGSTLYYFEQAETILFLIKGLHEYLTEKFIKEILTKVNIGDYDDGHPIKSKNSEDQPLEQMLNDVLKHEKQMHADAIAENTKREDERRKQLAAGVAGYMVGG